MEDSALSGFIKQHARLFVLTGAGCSTDSGIADYRDGDGEWKRTPPVSFQSFMADVRTRADELLSLKVSQPCAQALSFLLKNPVG